MVLCFFGDGASNTGNFHESLNMAALWKLPVVYIVENNLYGMSVPLDEGRLPSSDIADRGCAYGIPGEVVDGMDVLAVREAVAEAVDRARSGAGAVADRVQDLPLVRPLPLRPARLPHQGRGGRVEGARPHPGLRRAAGGGEASPRRPRSTRSRPRRAKAIEAATEFAFGSPTAAGRGAGAATSTRPSTWTRADMAARGASCARACAAGGPGTRKIRYWQAIHEALREEMQRDPKVFLMGEDVGLYGGAYGATRGLFEEFGAERVRDTPISEATIGGAAVGAAMAGMRPVAEIMYVDFTPLAMDQIANQGAKNRYMFGGKTTVPMVIRTEGGAGRSIAAHHSQTLEALWTHFPGIYVVMPATPYDAKGLLKAAIRDDNPVMFIEHKMLYGIEGLVPDEDYIIPSAWPT